RGDRHGAPADAGRGGRRDGARHPLDSQRPAREDDNMTAQRTAMDRLQVDRDTELGRGTQVVTALLVVPLRLLSSIVRLGRPGAVPSLDHALVLLLRGAVAGLVFMCVALVQAPIKLLAFVAAALRSVVAVVGSMTEKGARALRRTAARTAHS